MFQKTIGINDYYFGSDDWQYPLGHIQMLGKTNSDMLRDSAPRLVPGRALEEVAGRSLDFWLTSEDLPLPENRVTVNSSGQVVLRYKENNAEGHKRLVKKLRSMLKDIGCENRLLDFSLYMGKKIPPGRRGPSERYTSLWERPENFGAGPRLQGPRLG